MRFHKIKAFTQQGMDVIGNPATVMVVEDFPDDSIMGQAAKILAEPMTTFVRATDEDGVYDIRHFSPDGDECHVCGHATMAAAELLARENPALRNRSDIVFKMNPKFGVSDKSIIKAHIDGNTISLTLPAIMDLQPMTDPEFYRLLTEGLRVSEDDLVKPVYFAPRIRDIVVAFKDPNTLLALDPDFPRLKAMAIDSPYLHEGMMGTAPSNIEGFDIINRVFLPGIDVNEDVACGSANCSIIPFWATKCVDAFDAAKKDFRVIYPYPPGAKGYVGGIQHLHIDVQKGEIILTGQASYEASINITLPKKSPTLSRSPG